MVKASVLSLTALARATSPRRRDQFVCGRLFQDVHVVWARDEESARQVESAVGSARRVTLDWVAPDLPASFSPDEYLRQLFRTSFRYEVRPEASDRADALCAAQAPRLAPIFEGVLKQLAEEGLLQQTAPRTFALASAMGKGHPLRLRLFLEWSRVRATARWPKHAISFDGWLDYIVRKAERHSGETIVLGPWERRAPLLFLWPRVFRFLTKQRRRGRPV